MVRKRRWVLRTDLEVRCLREIQAYLKENPRDEFRGDTDFYQFTLGGVGALVGGCTPLV
jgi:hypothetical protein